MRGKKEQAGISIDSGLPVLEDVMQCVSYRGTVVMIIH